MRYTPVELRHVEIGRALFGYNRDETHQVLTDVADSFEDVWRERAELADTVEEIEKQLGEAKQRESLLANTLVSAERAAAEAKELAKREAEVIVAEAHQEARSIMRTAQTERERLFAEARRVETLLRAALGMVEESVAGMPQRDDAAPAGPPPERWPKREETREFQAVPLPQPDPVPDEADEPPAPSPLPPAADGGEDDGRWAGRDFAWG